MKKLPILALAIAIIPSLSIAETALKQEILAAHNQYRQLHHAPNLMWDETLANYAENYASRCKFQHSRGRYGENLAAGYPSPAVAVKVWYNENVNYSYEDPGFSSRTGHFTQVVWKSTRKIGCGYVDCDGKNGTPGMYLVCEYSPAGNITNRGYFNANVLSKN